MRVLVTGASGLLGSRMLKGLPADWHVTGTYHSRPAPGLVECRLGDRRSTAALLSDGPYDCVIHCAAIRSPDVCQEDPREAVEVNAHGTERVARAAAAAGVRMAYASTDAVFRGDSPPYAEDAAPAPASVYGHSKLAGERHALAVPGGLVVRMPALYSLDLDAPNNVLAGLRDSVRNGRAVLADDTMARYYTLAEDVAAAFAFLLASGRRGVVHVSAEETSTKCGFLRAAAEAMGLDRDLVMPAQRAKGAAPRPMDSRLDTKLYRTLGGPAFTGYAEALKRLPRP
jgi:dTDP-4-dehydrorhamnose reductase